MPNYRAFDEDYGRLLNPGALRHQVTYQQKNITSRNSFNEPQYTWQNVVTLKAQVKTLRGRELEAAQQRWAEAQYEIRHHRYSGLNEEMQISWYVDGQVKTLDLLSIGDPPGMGRYQCVYAKDHN